MEIKSISNKIFRSASKVPEQNANNASHTNPFGVNFKGNIITVDVFTKAAPEGSKIVERVAGRSRMLTSAIVGSMGSVSEAISRRLNSIASFGREMKSRVSNAWDLANRITIDVNIPNIVSELKNRITAMHEYSLNNLSRRYRDNIDGLKGLLQNEIDIRALGV